MDTMSRVFRKWKHSLDAIWQEEGQTAASRADGGAKKEAVGARMRAFGRTYRFDLAFILLMGCFLFFLAWILPPNGGPDEASRYLVPQYIYRHGTLPAGGDPEVRIRYWGISYAFHPILPYIFGGYLMRLVGLFHASDHALLMTARFVNILFGMGFYWYVLQLSRRLFRNRLFRIYFVALLAMLPQLLYLFVYVNTDGIALFSGAMILNYWLAGLERKWDKKSCTGLAVGISFCALSYFNAYGYALMSVFLFGGSLIVFYGRRGVKRCAETILKRGIYITVLVFALCGWWFIRCAILYDGDFLGLNAPSVYAEQYADEKFRPSVKKSVEEQGISLEKMLRPEAEGGMEWLTTTYRSTIGYFGFLEYPLGLDIYEIHKKLLLLGCLGILLQTGLAALYYLKRGAARMAEKAGMHWLFFLRKAGGSGEIIRKPSLSLPDAQMHPANFLMLQFSFICCIIIPVLLSLVYSYTDDFQPQGRYIMPMIVPLMYFAAAGTERVMALLFRDWFGRILMLLLLYAVLHVFLGAFLSVYIPAYCEPLAFLSDVRFPWFSNIGWLVKLLYLFIPG